MINHDERKTPTAVAIRVGSLTKLARLTDCGRKAACLAQEAAQRVKLGFDGDGCVLQKRMAAVASPSSDGDSGS